MELSAPSPNGASLNCERHKDPVLKTGLLPLSGRVEEASWGLPDSDCLPGCPPRGVHNATRHRPTPHGTGDRGRACGLAKSANWRPRQGTRLGHRGGSRTETGAH